MGTLMRTTPAKSNKEIRFQAWLQRTQRRASGSGLAYGAYQLWYQGVIREAFLWEASAKPLPQLAVGDHVECHGQWIGEPGKSRIRLKDVRVVMGGIPWIMAKHLYRSPNTEQIDGLIRWILQLQSPLRQFLIEVLSDANIAVPFVTRPASLSHHHAHPGGLLSHSLECALMCGQLALPWLNRQEAELTMVAAFLHDLGKVRTYRDMQSFSDTGQAVAHQALTLEVLSPHLAALERRWRTGADLLRHMLTWDASQSRFPAFPGTLLVRLADQFSTSTDRRQAAFMNRPRWHWVAQTAKHSQERYLRIPH